ncbi:hypothetical protein ACR2XN_28930 [Klebsiella pneumoniae]
MWIDLEKKEGLVKEVRIPPFPQRINQEKQRQEEQFKKFVEMFKQLKINIPFAEALKQMSSYVKFMKGILSKKIKLEDFESVALTEEVSAVLQRKLPPKLKDRSKSLLKIFY